MSFTTALPYPFFYPRSDNRRTNPSHIERHQAICIKRDDAQSWSNLGVLLQDRGRIEKAIVALLLAIQYNPRFSEAHANLGVILREQGRLDDAIQVFRRALPLQPAKSQSAEPQSGQPLWARPPQGAWSCANNKKSPAPTLARCITRRLVRQPAVR